MIYILTSDVVTGGPELLHQCAYYINKHYPGEAKIFYVGKRHPENFNYFSRYISANDIVEEINDSKDNIIIVPETFTNYLRPYTNIKKVLWWLSVDNYFLNYGLDFNSLEGKLLMFFRRVKRRYYSRFNALKTNELKTIQNHWFQSEYARKFLNEKYGVTGDYVGDFLNNELLNLLNSKPEIRKNIVLYNPKKGFKQTLKIITYFKNNPALQDIKFVPLVGFDKNGLREIFKTSKIYIDFGYHPGKDRMPREACVNGCVVITNTKGSAKNKIDIPIDDKYKFDDLRSSDLKNISNLFLDITKSFKQHQNAFLQYKEIILKEEEKFEKDLIEAVNKVSVDVRS